MRVIAKSTLREFWEKHPDAKNALASWYKDAEKATWRTPVDLIDNYSNVDTLPNNRAVFDIKGNSYRLVVKIHYNREFVYIRFVGTHDEYDDIDAISI